MVFQSFWRSRPLIWTMIRRDVVGRYRGSLMGVLWSVLNPLMMLGVYTFVFGVIFRARWAERTDSNADIATVLFAGLIVFAVFAECITRAPGLILGNVNYVKKVVFPLETLPWVLMGSTLFHSAMSVLVLLVLNAVLHSTAHWTMLLFPVVIFPLVLLTMGFSWILASLGVYLRDIGQVVGVLTTVMMFTCPIFYPVSSVPEYLRPYMALNPLTFIVEQARATLLWGDMPDWPGLGIYFCVSLLVAWFGLLWFQKTRRGFADVL